jgi:acyl-CoA hydrolase
MIRPLVHWLANILAGGAILLSTMGMFGGCGQLIGTAITAKTRASETPRTISVEELRRLLQVGDAVKFVTASGAKYSMTVVDIQNEAFIGKTPDGKRYRVILQTVHSVLVSRAGSPFKDPREL